MSSKERELYKILKEFDDLVDEQGLLIKKLNDMLYFSNFKCAVLQGQKDKAVAALKLIGAGDLNLTDVELSAFIDHALNELGVIE